MMKANQYRQEFQNNRCLNGYCPKNFVSSYKLGKEVVERLNEVNALLSKADKLQFTIEQPPKPVDEMPCDETIGLDMMFNKVWKSLEDNNVGIIGLYGMGGVGKTTLMKRIHSEFGKMEHSFDIVLWAVVSKDCDINKIMTDISNRLGIDESLWKRSSQDQRVAKIHEQLKGKKFVLMLDDLWEKLELQAIGVPVPKESNNKSKVVFTTRSEDVCAKMKAETKLEVKCLYDKEAFELFCNKVGDETLKCHTEIPKLAHEMAKECGGLPLALITVGSAMAGVESYDAWMDARNNLRSSPSKASDFVKVFRILKFSYDKLPDKAHKSCFLYCALYPEDFELYGDDLIDRWIGEGFLDKDGKSIYDMYNQGKSIIEKLILSCLLEEVIDSGVNSVTGWSCRKIKMHDVVRDMALWLGRDEDENKDKIVVQGEAFSMSEMDSERLNVVERISIITNWDSEESWKVPTCPNLITLCLNGMDSNAPALSLNFQCIKNLRVLDLSRNRYINLSSDIGELINLEFLKLSESGVVELPIALKKLKNLRVLHMDGIYNSFVHILLEVIESLEQLKVFRFSRGDYTSSQEEISLLEKLESLPKLEELCIELNTITGVQRLFHSTKLRDCIRHISIYVWKKEETKSLEMSSLLTSMSQMKHLEGIYLSSKDSLVDGSSITDKCHLGMLRQVSINFCHSITHLTWLRYAPLLETLEVFSCDSIEEVVKEAKDDEQAGYDSNNDNIFTNLKVLCLYDMPNLVSIHKRALDFPSLKHMMVINCPNLRKLPLNSSFASKNNLIEIRGRTEWWKNLEWDNNIIPTLLSPKFRVY